MKTWMAMALWVAGLLAAPAWAQDGLDAIGERIAQVPVLRGEFRQEKRVTGFKQPLRSQGAFLLARDQGVIWTTTRPFPSEVVLTRDRILSRQADGSTRVELDGRQQPALRAVNETMFALMTGDTRALSERFDVQAEAVGAQDWRLTLTPRSGTLARAFKRIALQGGRHVRQVELEEASGDRTLLEFSALRETPAELSDDEAGRFD